MNMAKNTDQQPYDPDQLLATLLVKLNLKNDAALSRALEVAPPVISKIRHRRLPVGASMLIRMHEVTELSIRDLRRMMGDRRKRFRISGKQARPRAQAARAGGAAAPPGHLGRVDKDGKENAKD
jgi:plasmid maintenance system antidote protein VapI